MANYIKKYEDVFIKVKNNEEFTEIENAIIETYKNEFRRDYLNDILEQRANIANEKGIPFEQALEEEIKSIKQRIPGLWSKYEELAKSYNRRNRENSTRSLYELNTINVEKQRFVIVLKFKI